MAWWIECQPVNQKVASSIPSQARSPGGITCERQTIDTSLTHWCFYPSLCPSLPLSLKINKWNLKKEKRILLGSIGLFSTAGPSWNLNIMIRNLAKLKADIQSMIGIFLGTLTSAKIKLCTQRVRSKSGMMQLDGKLTCDVTVLSQLSSLGIGSNCPYFTMFARPEMKL